MIVASIIKRFKEIVHKLSWAVTHQRFHSVHILRFIWGSGIVFLLDKIAASNESFSEGRGYRSLFPTIEVF